MVMIRFYEWMIVGLRSRPHHPFSDPNPLGVARPLARELVGKDAAHDAIERHEGAESRLDDGQEALTILREEALRLAGVELGEEAHLRLVGVEQADRDVVARAAHAKKGEQLDDAPATR